MKVAIVTVMVVLAMGTAFVGGLLAALKMTASRQEQAVNKTPITAAQLAATEEGAKAKEGEIEKGAEEKAKKELKLPTTDEVIATIDYSVEESRNAGKLLFRKKVAEKFKDTEKQFESESEKAHEKERLAASLQRWLERSKNH